MEIKKLFSHWIVPHFWARFFVMFFAIIFMGVTLSLLVEVGWGTDPYSFLNLNLSARVGWSLGNWQLLFNSVLILFTLVFNWRLIGFGTLVNMVCIGYTVDFSRWVWAKTGIASWITSSFWTQLAVFIVGIVLFVIFAAIYMNSSLGLSPYDAAIKIIAGWIYRVRYFILRIVYDLLAVAVGFISTFGTETGMQGSIIGSIVIALLLGPVITSTGIFMKKHIRIFQDE